ncbi:MAG: hypothetical protein V4819_14025 [Verrucomicrobiota bacterium]
MKTIPHYQQAAVVLKDGNTQLAAWIHSFHQQPTIGESIAIPARFHADLAGYEPMAIVSRIERRDSLPDIIDLEAACMIKRQDRPVIVVNSNRIRESLRGAAEIHLRSTLRFPLIDWEPSNQPDPVVRFHDPATGRKSCPPDVRAGLLDLLYQPACV